jgi:hypothetical protein
MQVFSETVGLFIEEFRIRRGFMEQLTEHSTQSAFIAPSLGRAKKGARRLSGRGVVDRV